MKKALIVGIDDYSAPNNLNGCVNDASSMAAMLGSNGDGSPNFDVRKLISSEARITSQILDQAICDLFRGDAETVLFYFAGHGVVNNQTNNGFLITQDGSKPNWGIGLSGLLERANSAYPRIRSTVILLDSCQAGFMGEVSGIGSAGVSHVGTGVTVLAACHKEGVAEEVDGHGKFTNIMLDGLAGAASDILGRITPASLYAHIDQTLGGWEQRPLYKANVQSFVTLREVEARVPKTVLRKLVDYFPTPSHVFSLDPSFEPNRGEETERLKDVPVDPEHVRIYRELQMCNRFGLVKPFEHEHMWHSAVFCGGCKLTASGAHFRKLAELKRI